MNQNVELIIRINEETCPICLDLSNTDNMIKPCSSCNTYIHYDCYKEMFKNNIRYCPTCRINYKKNKEIILNNNSYNFLKLLQYIFYTLIIFYISGIVGGFVIFLIFHKYIIIKFWVIEFMYQVIVGFFMLVIVYSIN